jgi:hypothetical protein
MSVVHRRDNDHLHPIQAGHRGDQGLMVAII